MSLFLLWKNINKRHAVEEVEEKLHSIFKPFYKGQNRPKTLHFSDFNLIFISPDERNYRVKFFEEDTKTIAIALYYPINLQELTTSPKPLIECGKILKHSPEIVLGRLMPMYALLIIDKENNSFTLQTDALGASPLYQYKTDDQLIFTNKIFSLNALGITPKPILEEWAFKLCFKYMPNNATGFSNIRKFAPGEQIYCNAHSYISKKIDVLEKYFFPDTSYDLDNCLELANTSMNKAITNFATLSSEAIEMPLTGGFDTRVIASILMKHKIPSEFCIIDEDGGLDTLIAQELAHAVGKELHVTNSQDCIPDTDEDLLLESVQLSLLWRDCLEDIYQQKYMGKQYAENKRTSAVLLSGKSGEIGRFRLAKISPFTEFHSDGARSQFKQKLQNIYLSRNNFQILKEYIHPHIIDYIQSTSCDLATQSLPYGQTSHQMTHYHYVMNDERNFRIGTFARSFSIKGSPFLHPGFISASYALGKYDVKDFNMIHRHITKESCPPWKNISYVIDRVNYDEYMKLKTNSGFDNDAFWKQMEMTKLKKEYCTLHNKFFAMRELPKNPLICDAILLLKSLHKLSE